MGEEVIREDLQQEMELLKKLRVQTKQEMEILEARERTIAELVRDITDNEDTQVHAMGIIENKRILILDVIENFQRVRTLEDSLRLYVILISLCSFVLKLSPQVLEDHLTNIKRFTNSYMGWFREYRLSHRIHVSFFSNVMKTDIFFAFYEVVDILLNTKLITADDIKEYRKDYIEDMSKVREIDKKFEGAWGAPL